MQRHVGHVAAPQSQADTMSSKVRRAQQPTGRPQAQTSISRGNSPQPPYGGAHSCTTSVNASPVHTGTSLGGAAPSLRPRGTSPNGSVVLPSRTSWSPPLVNNLSAPSASEKSTSQLSNSMLSAQAAQVAQAANTSQASKNAPDLEAERRFWSEQFEKQVKSLESTLRGEFASCQDKLSSTVDNEQSQLRATLADMRREIDNQHDTLVEVAQSQLELRSQEENRARTELGSLGKGAGSELLNQVKDAHQMLAKLRRDFECQQRQSTQMETMFNELRSELDAVKDSQQPGQSTEEVRALHEVVIQSAGDLGQGIEEISNVVVATEQRLRQEIDATRCALEEKNARHGTEILEALELSCSQMAESLQEERQRRTSDTTVMQEYVSAVCKKVQEVEDAVAILRVQDVDLRNTYAPTQAKMNQAIAESDPLRNVVEQLCQDLSRLDDLTTHDRAANANAVADARRHAEESATAVADHVGNLQAEFERLLADGLAEESQARAASLFDMRNHMDNILHKADIKRGEQSTEESYGHSGEIDSAQDVLALVEEMSLLKAGLQTTSETASRAEADIRGMLIDSQKSSWFALAQRLESVEERCNKHTLLNGRVDSLESGLKANMQASELERIGHNVELLENAVQALVPQVEAAFSEAQMAGREAKALSERFEATDGDVQKLIQAGTQTPRHVKAIRIEVEALRMRLFSVASAEKTQPATAAPSGGTSETTLQGHSSCSGSPRTGSPRSMPTSASIPVSASSPSVVVATTQSPQAAAAGSPGAAEGIAVLAEAPLPGLSADLKQSITRLVDRVKLMANPDDSPIKSLDNRMAAGGAAAAAAAARGASAPGTLEGLHAPPVTHGFGSALQAVQEFREHSGTALEDNGERPQENTAQAVSAPVAVKGGLHQGLRPVSGAWTGSPLTSPRPHQVEAPTMVWQSPGTSTRRLSGSATFPVQANSPQSFPRLSGAGLSRSPSGGSAVMPASRCGSVNLLPTSPKPPQRFS